MCSPLSDLLDENTFVAPSAEVQAIDVHGHYGSYSRGEGAPSDEWASADAATIVARARQANTRLTIVSPMQALTPRLDNDAVAGNEDAARVVAETGGFLQWVVVDPRKPRTYEQAAEMLGLPKCVGIKIHPEEHGYRIAERGREIFEFAAERDTVIETHSGEQNSLPEDYVPFANEFPEVTLILSHLGCGWDDDHSHQVRAIQACEHDNVFLDTSSAQSIMPGLIEWAVGEIGAERMLYGTDTPCYFSPMQRARINYADITEREKRLILCENAEKIFNV